MRMGLGLGLSQNRKTNIETHSDECDSKPILCGDCNSVVKGPPNPKPQDVLACNCGNSDTFENVQRILGEALKEHAARHLQESMKRATASSKNLKFQGTPVMKRKHRFYVDIDG